MVIGRGTEIPFDRNKSIIKIISIKSRATVSYQVNDGISSWATHYRVAEFLAKHRRKFVPPYNYLITSTRYLCSVIV